MNTVKNNVFIIDTVEPDVFYYNGGLIILIFQYNSGK